MDLSAIMGGNTPPNKAEQPKFEYTAQVTSSLVNGEVKMTIGDGAFTVTALFDAAEIAYAEINALIFEDYAVTIKTDSGDYTFSRVGEWAQRFFEALCDAYNKAVLRSLFVGGKPLVTAKGEYRFTESGAFGALTKSQGFVGGEEITEWADFGREATEEAEWSLFQRSGSAPIHVYENSVVSLPPDCAARRVPLCFVNGIEKGDYSLTLTLGTGENYTYAKLGYDTTPVETAIEKQVRALREKTLAAVKEIDPTLTTAQATQIAKIAPQGAAAPIGRLAAIAPSFVAALETKIAATRAAGSYATLKELCDPMQIWVGFRKNKADKDASGMGALVDGLGGIVGGVAPAEGETAEAAAPSPYLLWLIAPSPGGQYAAVEFAEADSATFIYHTRSDFTTFARQINRAMEAIDFKREVIWLTEADLRKPENADYYMAEKHTPALQFVRSNFAGRVIHSSPEAWKRKLTEIWSVGAAKAAGSAPNQTEKTKFCEQCGAAITPGVKFCGRCGAKIKH